MNSKRIVIVLQILLAAATSLFASDAKIQAVAESSPVAVDNAYFRVLKNSIGSAESNTNIGTRVIVALTNCVVQSRRGSSELQRGQIAVFRVDETFKPPTGEYFEVAFKLNHPPLKAPEKWIEPLKNTLSIRMTSSGYLKNAWKRAGFGSCTAMRKDWWFASIQFN